MDRRPIRSFLSQYERTRVLSLRASALANGAPTTLSHLTDLPSSAIEIAHLELEQGVVPMRLVRTLPSGRQEVVDVNDPTRLVFDPRIK